MLSGWRGAVVPCGRVNVLIFNSSLRVGGAESMSIALANALARAGATVSFASAGGPLRDNLDGAVGWHRVPNPNHAPLRSASALRTLLRERRPDVVHSHGGTCSLVAAMAVRGVHPRPARVLTHHSRIFRRAPAPVSAWLMRRCADRYVAISTDKLAALEEIGVPRERISLIPNFVDVDAVAARVGAVNRIAMRQSLGVPDDALVAVIAGRVLPEKGFDRFVRIVARAARALAPRPVHGIAVGDGPFVEDVRRLAADESGAAVVHFPGYQRDVFPYLAVADVALFPTRHPEVLPMFLIECAAAGLPAVCSNIPGNRDIVAHERSGLLVDGDDDTWADLLAALLSDDARRAEMSRAGLAIARERFDERRVIAETLALYEAARAAQ